MRKDAATLWYIQVDAAARDKAEVDGGGARAAREQREEEGD